MQTHLIISFLILGILFAFASIREFKLGDESSGNIHLGFSIGMFCAVVLVLTAFFF